VRLSKYRYSYKNQGHGTLNAIYAATEKACEARDWVGVDVLIIGGDFQVWAASLNY
jgi:lariat debranching enzyme